MTSHVAEGSFRRTAERASHAWSDVSAYLVPVGRVLFAAIFLLSVPSHFQASAIEHAASKGVPLASVAVPLSGVMAGLGGLSVAIGYRARLGALLIALFLIPVTFMMHDFWNVAGPEAMTQRIAFMKNMSMLGAAFLLAHFGAGPFSLDSRRGHRSITR